MSGKWIRLSVYGFLGMGAGFAYYYFIGCNSGACPITSNPFISTGYGLAAGLILGWNNKKSKKN
ncbi:MAG: hypothetical protein JXR46_11260 [Calditrichaceae bacterium]|nr:hypothetical protein [Calditrichaceae bacterium]MBN2709612.1 hypothetical protein [Calditrichaceae bacterium]RQV92409.1 MAG: hypothetical protein EH224_15525 [Calditrichota bacterium]